MSVPSVFELREQIGPFESGTRFEFVGEVTEVVGRDVRLEEVNPEKGSGSLLLTREEFDKKLMAVDC